MEWLSTIYDPHIWPVINHQPNTYKWKQYLPATIRAPSSVAGYIQHQKYNIVNKYDLNGNENQLDDYWYEQITLHPASPTYDLNGLFNWFAKTSYRQYRLFNTIKELDRLILFERFTLHKTAYNKDMDEYNIYFSMLSYEATQDRNEDYFKENNNWLTRIKRWIYDIY